MAKGSETPNPGSYAALDLGCICAVMDNNHGNYSAWPGGGYWITEGCPLHDPREDLAEATDPETLLSYPSRRANRRY